MSFLEKFDNLAISVPEYETLTEKEILDRVQKRNEYIRKMSDDEIAELLSRNIVVQYKMKIVRIREGIE